MRYEGFQTIPKFTVSKNMCFDEVTADPFTYDPAKIEALPAKRIFVSVTAPRTMGIAFAVGDSSISSATPGIFLQGGFSGIFNVAGHTHYKAEIPPHVATSADLPIWLSVSGIAT